jgi:hypothetical protein
LVDLAPWRAQYTPERWRNVLESSVAEESFGQRPQEASRRGRPLASEDFIGQLEQLAGRDLRPQPVGHPRKGKTKERDQLSMKIGV